VFDKVMNYVVPLLEKVCELEENWLHTSTKLHKRKIMSVLLRKALATFICRCHFGAEHLIYWMSMTLKCGSSRK